MKRNICFFLFLVFYSSCTGLFAFGKKDLPADKGPVNSDWTICITAPDVSSLPLTRQITGDAVVRNLAKSLQNLDFRIRGEEESAYYQDYAWTKASADAARALDTKRRERDLIVYRGDPKWKYRKNIKSVDADILKLENTLAEISAKAPLVESKPLIKLMEGNKSGTFPSPPAEGGEYRFCTEQKADAFVLCSLAEYHGRLFLNVRMYTLYTRSYTFEDSILFSSDDFGSAMDEISVRLAMVISGSLPAGLVIHASPEAAIVAIDGSFTARDEMHMLPQGTADISVRSDNYVPLSVPLDLKAGEIAEMFVDLTPIGLAAFEANVPGKPGSKVFLGGLYVGETPLSLELPRSEYMYISVETPEGEIGSMAYRDNSFLKGSAQFIQADGGGSASFNTKLPVSAEEKRVDRARRGFYWAYGAFWFILPASILLVSHANSYINEYNYAMAYYNSHNSYPFDAKTMDKVTSRANTWNYIRIGAHITWGAALGVTFFQIFRYLYVSRTDATPILKVQPKEEEK